MKMLFIGAGKMATALAAGIVKNQLLSAADLLACDISAEARRAFTATTGVRFEPTAQALVADADVLLLAVKPRGGGGRGGADAHSPRRLGDINLRGHWH